MVLELDAIAKLVARREDPPALEALKAVWLVPAAMRSTDAREVGEFDEAFHATLVSAAGNAEIAKVHQDVTERIRIVRRLDFTRADRIEATYQEHAKILRAVIQRKLDVGADAAEGAHRAEQGRGAQDQPARDAPGAAARRRLTMRAAPSPRRSTPAAPPANASQPRQASVMLCP